MARQPCKVFVSFAPMDGVVCGRLMRMLKVQTALSSRFEFLFWDDRIQFSGEKAKTEIQQAIDACDIGLLLLTSKFADCEFIRSNELPWFVGPEAKPRVTVEVDAVDYQLDEDPNDIPFRHGKHTFKACKGRQQKLFVQGLARQLDEFAASLALARDEA